MHGQTKLYELITDQKHTCPGCLAKDAHIDTLKSLLDRESHHFHDLNKVVLENTGVISNPVDRLAKRQLEEMEQPVGGRVSFSELRAKAEEVGRKLAAERAPESKQVEERWKNKGARPVKQESKPEGIENGNGTESDGRSE